MKRSNRPERRTQRRDEAIRRQAIRDKRDALTQLAELDDRFGAGNGAKRERARLNN
tara:strand:+ start:2682 stop:2849 length:168 start_codon:yes stop_codon:yes gene_type:complete